VPLKQITFPRHTLVVLSGPAGSGKSTWAAKHFSPMQVVSSDQCRELISDDPADQSVTSQAFRLMHHIIRERLMLGRFTVADATSLKSIDRRMFLRLARRFDFKIAAVVFNLPLEICLKRNRVRDRIVPGEAVLAQYDLLQDTLDRIDREGFDYIYVLTEQSAVEVAVRIGGRA
jgi:predicted kinase